ncbi:Metallo-peptidase family M12B Reprolysin-like [Fragilaria crotonensis]|nr:Metallo-peptidase family M12B Reprolysin-like [Fragilaria crotonensis]
MKLSSSFLILLFCTLTILSCASVMKESSSTTTDESDDENRQLAPSTTRRHKIKTKGSSKVVAVTSNGKIKRRRSIVDLSGLQLGDSAQDVDVQLMSDEQLQTLRMRRANTENDPFESWYGRDTKTGNHLTIVKSTTNWGETVTTGSMHGQNGTVYQIRTLANGAVVAEEIKQEMFNKELDGVRTHVKGGGGDIDPETIDAIDGLPGGGRRGLRNERRLDSSSQLDVMVLYTKGAMCSAAGFSTGGTCTATPQNVATIEGIIALAVAETNKAFELSGIPTEFRLVKAHYDASYNDYATSWESTLGYLRNNGDGRLDYVHAMRDQYGADFVTMLVDTDGYCGIGYLPSSPRAADAFTLVHWDCATGYYSFGHEIGHNMGCNHDIKNAGSRSGYNYGYQDPSARFRSILAYDCSKKSCPRVQYYSSPNLSYLGSPLGTATANNALVIRNNLAAFANYRQSINQQPVSSAPTAAPTAMPTTKAPTSRRPTTKAPTSARPSASPTAMPTTAAPTAEPTTAAPTVEPTSAAPNDVPPTAAPTGTPTGMPTNVPIAAPTDAPTAVPTKAPTAAPTTANSRSLTTTFVGGTVGAAGHMFDIKATKNLNVTNFAVHASSASLATVEVYMKKTTGAFSGTQSRPAKWRKIGTATFTTKSAGSPSILPEGTFSPVTVKAGVTQAFYITFTQATNINRYSVGSSLGSVHVFNSDLTIYNGYAKFYPFRSDVTLRAWNGILYYRTI